VIGLFARGCDTTQVGHVLGIRPVTVSKHLESAKRKLDVRTRSEAIAIAVAERLVRPRIRARG
jgi:DNA-binding CsgD family transcriptional regulator